MRYADVYSPKIGSVSIPKDFNPYVFKHGNVVVFDKVPVLNLKDGDFGDYLPAVGLNICSNKLKTTIELNKADVDTLQWFEVVIENEELERRKYQILHFPEVKDLLDGEKTIFSGVQREIVVKPYFKLEAIIGCNIFAYPGRMNSWAVSEFMKKKIEQSQCSGIMFSKITTA